MLRSSITGIILFISSILFASMSWAFSVYVMSGGNNTADQVVLDALTSRGHTPTLGVTPAEWDGTQANLDDFEVVVLLNSYNWSVCCMSTTGQVVLLNYVAGGGGLITGEWFIGNVDDRGHFPELVPLVPANREGWGSGSSTAYTQVTTNPIINNGLPTFFAFPLNNIGGGSESFLIAKGGATVFYDSVESGYNGLVGWDYEAGRVISFSTFISEVEMADSNYATLFVNAVEWASGDESTDNQCPVATALEEDPNKETKLKLLRRFRDEVLGASPEGEHYVESFYTHAVEVSWLLLRYPELRPQGRVLIDHSLPVVQNLLASKQAVVGQDELKEVEVLLGAFAAYGSAELQADIQAVQAELRKREVLEQFGIVVR